MKKNKIILIFMTLSLILSGCNSSKITYDIANDDKVLWDFEKLNMTVANVGFNGFFSEVASQKPIDSIELVGLDSNEYVIELTQIADNDLTILFFEYLQIINYDKKDQVKEYMQLTYEEQEKSAFKSEFQKLENDWTKDNYKVSDKLNFYDVAFSFSNPELLRNKEITQVKFNFSDGTELTQEIGKIDFLIETEEDEYSIIPSKSTSETCGFDICVETNVEITDIEGKLELKNSDIISVEYTVENSNGISKYENEPVNVKKDDVVTINISYKNNDPSIVKNFKTEFEISGKKYFILTGSFFTPYTLNEYVLMDNGVDLSNMVVVE